VAEFATVKLGALSDEAREVLAAASEKWRRLPMRHAAVAADLERYGLVEIEQEWQWSKTDPGAGRHVWMWRKRTTQPKEPSHG
jgi:hypothetical protein